MNEINVIYKRCLNCGENLNHTEGKREKVFCNTTCRSNYWQKSERLEKKGLSVEQIVSAIEKSWKSKTREMNQKILKQIEDSVFPDLPKVGVVINPDYVTVSYVEPKPEKLKGEKEIDYLIRLDESEKSKTKP